MDKPVKTVLAIDDDDNFNHLIQLSFKKLGLPVEITTTTSGSNGFDLINQNTPDLILLDIRMPVMDGFEVLSELDKRFPDKGLRIIILSSSYRKEDREKAFRHKNVLDYREKPMKLTELRELITELYNEYIKS